MVNFTRLSCSCLIFLSFPSKTLSMFDFERNVKVGNQLNHPREAAKEHLQSLLELEMFSFL
jgi:hypothetical protein